MKIVYVFAVLFLLVKSGYCVEDEPKLPPKNNMNTMETTEVPPKFESIPTVEDAPKEAKQNEELKDALDIKDGGDADSQGTHLNFKPSIQEGLNGNGVTYTRWGKMTCPSEATLIYDGYVAGGHYGHPGDGANYLCMPRNPQYYSHTTVSWPSYLYGAEYETNNRILYSRGHGTTQDYNVPCAVCQSKRLNKLMIPARYQCPSSWKTEYSGYLMTSYYGHAHPTDYKCVDYYVDVIPGSKGNTDGALLYFVVSSCGAGLPCGPYLGGKAITCVVCTK